MAEVEIGIGKSGRRAYGLDDIAIVPSRRTRDPEDVDISWEIDAFTFDLPLMAAAMDGVISPATAIEIGRLGGVGVLNLEGLWTRYEDPDSHPRGDRGAPAREGHPADAGDLQRADQARADRRAHPRDPRRRRGVVRVGHPAAHRRLRQGHHRRRARPAGHPGHGRVGRARVEDRRAAQPQALRARARHAGDRRRLRQLPGRAAPHAHRCRRHPRRRRSRRTPAPPAACSASACPRPPPSPTPGPPACATSTRPACTSTSSPTAAWAPAATSPRPSSAAPTR